MIKVILNDIIKIISGGTPKTNVKEYWDDGEIGWLSVNDFNNDNRYVYDSEKKITQLGVKNSNTKYLLQGDIIISARGTVGALAQIGKPMCFNQSCFGIRGKENIVDTDFLYYGLKNYVQHIVKRSQGSVFDTINLASFNLMELQIPEKIETQKQIAKVLSDLDAKIEVNNQINAKLEAMAKTLYEYWFVQFDFPSPPTPEGGAIQGKPYKSSGGKMVYNDELKREIPEGWEVGKFKDVLDELQSGNRPKGGIKNIEKGIPSIGAENILSIGKYNYGNEKIIPEEFFNKMTNGVVKSSDVLMYKDGASLGRVSMFKNGFPYEKCCINSHAFILRTNEIITQNFLYFWLDQDFMKEIIRRAGMRAAQPGINQENVKDLIILLPDIETVQNFEKLISSSIDKIFFNALENQKLAELRDWLLPMLMNGQVSVGEVGEYVNQAAEHKENYNLS